MTWTDKDYQHMSHALQLARRGLYTTHPNPRVGCILVKQDKIIAEGWHKFTGAAHAEIHALEMAGEDAQGADCYVTLEPCTHTGKTPPCADAIIKAGIKRVISATTDPNPVVSGRGFDMLEKAGIKTEVGLLLDQAQALNAGFEKRMRHGLPLVRCKMAMSIDGRTAMADGESKWITSESARLDVQKWRAQSDVIMTGINTILIDDPSLDVRKLNAENRQPVRVILDRNLRTPVNAKILKGQGEIKIFTQSDDRKKRENLHADNLEIIQIDANDGNDYLEKVLSCLAKQYEINEILLEAGPTLSGNLLSAGLIDEIIVYLAPVLMGNKANPMFALPGISKLSDKIPLKVIDVRNTGSDIRFIIRPVHNI